MWLNGRYFITWWELRGRVEDLNFLQLFSDIGVIQFVLYASEIHDFKKYSKYRAALLYN